MPPAGSARSSACSPIRPSAAGSPTRPTPTSCATTPGIRGSATSSPSSRSAPEPARWLVVRRRVARRLDVGLAEAPGRIVLLLGAGERVRGLAAGADRLADALIGLL